MFLLFVIVCLLIIALCLNSLRRPYRYPAGPRWYPIVGNLPELKKLSKSLGGQYLAFTELSKLYNTNVVGLKLGKELVIVVLSYPLVKEVLTKEEYEGRPKNFFIRLRSMGTNKGVTCTDGNLWHTQRNFLVKHLRDLGFGKTPMEYMIKEEVQHVLEVLQENSSDVQIGSLIAPSVINVLWALVAGYRIARSDPQLQTLLDLLNKRGRSFDMSGGILSLHPWLRYVAPEWTGYNLLVKLNSELKRFFMKAIDEHKQKWSEGKNDDIIYNFIGKMNQNNNGIKSTFDDDQLVMVCLDIFIAGSQTTSNTLDFAFLMMILHPDVQKKVHAKLDELMMGTSDKTIEYTDRHKIPYVEAVLLEVERYCHVVPVAGPRRVLRDTVLDGYHIPKDTTVLFSLYSVHTDKEYWGDPQVFRPERFLDESGKVVYNDRLLPFGYGRRRCIGEILARQCIFMFFANILQKYDVLLAPKSNTPKGIPLPGITLTPERYTAQFIKR